MKVVYLASPYRNESQFEVYKNIHQAQLTARDIWGLGLACISPCGNTAFFSGLDIPDSVWLDGDLEILRRCDVLFVNDGWQTSSGCKNEIALAKGMGIPIFHHMANLKEWANEQK